LAEEMREHPQVPTPFVAGPVLTADKPSVFKGRKDLVSFIDHDLTGDRRGPLWLCGQRRMGKSSLLEMLPVQLGAGTEVVKRRAVVHARRGRAGMAAHPRCRASTGRAPRRAPAQPDPHPLRREGRRAFQVAVPMFAAWIRDQKGSPSL
jgi:hypothetical protein